MVRYLCSNSILLLLQEFENKSFSTFIFSVESTVVETSCFLNYFRPKCVLVCFFTVQCVHCTLCIGCIRTYVSVKSSVGALPMFKCERIFHIYYFSFLLWMYALSHVYYLLSGGYGVNNEQMCFAYTS